MKTLIVALVLGIAPAAAFAQCSGSTTMSCAPGTTYDAATGTCVATTT